MMTKKLAMANKKREVTPHFPTVYGIGAVCPCLMPNILTHG